MAGPKPNIADAVDALRAGKLVVIPTDTVYGLAVALDASEGVHEVFVAKGRPEFRPLPVLGATIDDLGQIASFNPRARHLAEAHWPGPLTLVLPRAVGFDAYLGEGGEETVAVRMPDHPLAMEILAAAGPLAVTSANRSGEAPAHTIDRARDALGDSVAVYVEAGSCSGTPSTIVSLAGQPRILRPGALHIEL